MSDWYQKTATQVLTDLGTSAAGGLTNSEAAERLIKYGPNELQESRGISPWKIIWEQLSGIFVIILVVAAVISLFLGDYADAVVILLIVVLNAALGFQQEYKAEQSMAALKRLAVPVVKARRDKNILEITARELVPGDIVILETGNRVPADGRVIQNFNLRVEEASLTGESEPIEKDAGLVFETDRPLGDRRNMIYSGTIINYGRGEMVVTETGMHTELGHIARLMQGVESEPTPLQQRLDKAGKALAVAALGIVAVIFVLGLLRGEDWLAMFETAVSLAVAAVPEALPAVATIALALGAQRMLKRNALIRKLPAVETLGSVSVICSDKTGTLTQNQMAVTVMDIANQKLDLIHESSENGLEIVPQSGKQLAPGMLPTIDLLLMAGTLANDAMLQHNTEDPDQISAIGDPTETALILAAARLDLNKDDLDRAFPRVAEVPFDSVRKRMTTVHRTPQSPGDVPSSLMPVWDRRINQEPAPYVIFTKGAIDGLLNIASEVLVEGERRPLDDAWRTRIMEAHDQMAKNGMRILGGGVRPVEELPEKQDAPTLEKDLILLGLFGLMDPPRPEVKDAVTETRSAGIRTVMITGDHPLTARHVADQLGITDNGRYITGQELDRLNDDELIQTIKDVNVFARVSPEHKITLVNAFQGQGYIVSMTGDGVNDAPALRKADIGVAMGITGTDVAKEAADMVLQDDNFATIVAAVEEGRVIYDNIRRVIRYLLSCNSAEIAVMLLGPLFGMPLPLLPLQILWMNLVTDGLPALALAVEPAEKDVMIRPPNPASSNIFDRWMVTSILWVGLVMAALSLFAGNVLLQRGQAYWQTMVFTTLTISQIAFAMAARSDRSSIFRIGITTNRSLLWASLLTVGLQFVLIYVPFFNSVFKTSPLAAGDILLSFGLSLLLILITEIVKWLDRRWFRRNKPA
jgi:Ca2+-transporting ATPase